MRIKEISLVNFRNYQKVVVNGFQDINIFVGKNAQGKTNLLESILLLSTTRSHREASNTEVISYDCDYGRIIGKYDSNNQDHSLKVVFSRTGKYLEIDNQEVKKISDYIGNLNVVMFSPTDLFLLDDLPKERRKFIDVELGKISKNYLINLINYNLILKKRNAVLKVDKVDLVLLETLTNQLIDCCMVIYEKRFKFIKQLEFISNLFYQKFNFSNSKLSIKYNSFVNEDVDHSKVKSILIDLYQKNLEKDMLLKSTNIGIHRDDFALYIDDKPFINYASQGQKRVAVLCLKLSLLEIVKKVKNEYPILLLDDVLSELDDKRKEVLLNLVPPTVQTFITTTDIDEKMIMKRKNAIYRIHDGIID